MRPFVRRGEPDIIQFSPGHGLKKRTCLYLPCGKIFYTNNPHLRYHHQDCRTYHLGSTDALAFRCHEWIQDHHLYVLRTLPDLGEGRVPGGSREKQPYYVYPIDNIGEKGL